MFVCVAFAIKPPPPSGQRLKSRSQIGFSRTVSRMSHIIKPQSHIDMVWALLKIVCCITCKVRSGLQVQDGLLALLEEHLSEDGAFSASFLFVACLPLHGCLCLSALRVRWCSVCHSLFFCIQCAPWRPQARFRWLAPHPPTHFPNHSGTSPGPS
jgi:hypothetical protein